MAAWVFAQACGAAAIYQKSTHEAEGDGKAATKRETIPGRYWRSQVNSEMKASCLCCLADQGSETLLMAKDSGL
jgi:hypothetical protein